MSSGSCLSSPPSAAMNALVVQKVHLQPDERLALGVQCEPGVVHAVVIEVEEEVGRLRIERSRIERPGRHRDQGLIEQRGDAHLRRERHRVERAALLVLEGLADAQVIKGPVRMVDAADGDERAVGTDRTGASERCGCALEERLAQRCCVRAGPPPPKYRNTGRSGTAASSSASVGCRRSSQMFGVPAPIAVMNAPGGTSPRSRRALRIASTSATLLASSHCATWYPGRFARLTKCVWLSMRPGTTVAPLRSMTRASLPPSPWPTSAKRPLRMVTDETTRLRSSMVWILPFTRTRSRSFSFPRPRARASVACATPAVSPPPVTAATPASALAFSMSRRDRRTPSLLRLLMVVSRVRNCGA